MSAHLWCDKVQKRVDGRVRGWCEAENMRRVKDVGKSKKGKTKKRYSSKKVERARSNRGWRGKQCGKKKKEKLSSGPCCDWHARLARTANSLEDMCSSNPWKSAHPHTHTLTWCIVNASANVDLATGQRAACCNGSCFTKPKQASCNCLCVCLTVTFHQVWVEHLLLSEVWNQAQQGLDLAHLCT